ncbi:MAG: hypothetical protein KKA07_09285 [Bacteroidetes bacterium]|nr:hypothetical protein [Bacteroidota bacterium]MBU1719254.1 hypothetical protein [Bacteroidota bacterium]
MDARTMRVAGFYRYSSSNKYMENDKLYNGTKGILSKAWYNYSGLLTGYGVTDKLTIEAEAGYYFNKTQKYNYQGIELTGSGLSNAVVSIKPRIYFHPDKRIEFSLAAGANLPFSTKWQEKNGVTLPVDIQPSTGSYGVVLQSFLVKENSFRGIRFFWVNRYEKYFENKQGYLFGPLYTGSLYFSKHFVFEKYKLKDWTTIIQLKSQNKASNFRNGTKVNASGSVVFFLIPQLNASIADKWNVSVLADIPIYQKYKEIQLATSFSFAVSIIRDIEFKK